MAITIQIPSVNPDIADIHSRFEALKPVARKIAEVLGIADPTLDRFVGAPLVSTILGERLTYQLPPEKAENSFKFYPMIGYITRLVFDRYQELITDDSAFNSALRAFSTDIDCTDRDDAALKLALREVFSNKVLVGPTSGSFGIGVLKMAEALRALRLENQDLFDDQHTITGIPLFPPEPTEEMPQEKWETIKRLHSQQNQDLNAKTLPDQPYLYATRSTRDEDALRLLIETFNGDGFYTPTNPLSLNEVAALAKIIVANSQSVSALTPVQRDLLKDFFIDVDENTDTLIITRPFGGGVAGSAQSLFDAEQYFVKIKDGVVAVFPTSAGPGAGGVALSDFAVELAPDPSSPHWASFLGQQRFYINPVGLGEDGDATAPAANGMGSTLKPENIVALLVANKTEDVYLTETTDVLRCLARALLHIDLTASAVLAGRDSVPFPELAAATPLAAQLEKKLRQASKESGGVEAFAKRIADSLKVIGIEANDFWRYASRGAPHQDAPDIPATLTRLAEIQGQCSDGDQNFLAPFVAAFAQELGNPEKSYHTLGDISEVQDCKKIIIIQVTGLNAAPDPNHARLKGRLKKWASKSSLIPSDDSMFSDSSYSR
ncbi:MAG: hypothetical protein ACK5O4_01440 [bacterium]|jgi:hypothetical protein